MALGAQQLPSQQHQKLMTAQQRQLIVHQRTIAPAMPPSGATVGHSRSSNTSSTARLYMPYAKPPATYVNMTGTTLDSNNPSVVRRNARERNRVKQVNNGFVNLRQHLPQAIVADLSNGRRGGTGPGASKKLSKVDTLRMAVEYIRRLKRVIDEVDQSDNSSVSSFNSCSSTESPLSGSSSPSATAPMNAEYFSGTWNFEQQSLNSFYALNFQQQQQQMISPAASTTSSSYSEPGSTGSACDTISYLNNSNQLNTLNTALKFEPATYDEYKNNSAEDEELLDYISLWQEDM